MIFRVALDFSSSNFSETCLGFGRYSPSMESHRVGHDWRDLAAAAAAHFLVVLLYSICKPWMVWKNNFFFHVEDRDLFEYLIYIMLRTLHEFTNFIKRRRRKKKTQAIYILVLKNRKQERGGKILSPNSHQ